MDASNTRCILTFSNQSKYIHNIFKKYWSLLTNDPILSQYVAEKPSITYRRCSSIRDNLVKSHYIDPTFDTSRPVGTTPCGIYDAGTFLDTRSKVELPNGQIWHNKKHVTCNTMGVVYLLQCPCKSFYVGKTSRPLSTRILEHIDSAKSGYFRTAIGRHIVFTHNYEFTGFKFLPLAVIPPPIEEVT